MRLPHFSSSTISANFCTAPSFAPLHLLHRSNLTNIVNFLKIDVFRHFFQPYAQFRYFFVICIGNLYKFRDYCPKMEKVMYISRNVCKICMSYRYATCFFFLHLIHDRKHVFFKICTLQLRKINVKHTKASRSARAGPMSIPRSSPRTRRGVRPGPTSRARPGARTRTERTRTSPPLLAELT